MEKATLGQQLKKYRKQFGLTQDQVADHFSIRRQTYSNYERDIRTPDLQTLCAFAAFYHISVDRLLQSEYLKDGDISEFYHTGVIPSSNSSLIISGSEAKLLMDYRSLSEPRQSMTRNFIKFMKKEEEGTD